MSAYDSTIHQWQRGERRLEQAPAERARLLAGVRDAIVAELRRRLGGRFSTEELAELYDRGTTWCLQVAMDTAPAQPWAWDSSIVVDAAFARYVREAADFAGGRRIPAESSQRSGYAWRRSAGHASGRDRPTPQ